jgi:hypothetical protein
MLCTMIGWPAPITTEPTRTARVGFRGATGSGEGFANIDGFLYALVIAAGVGAMLTLA